MNIEYNCFSEDLLLSRNAKADAFVNTTEDGSYDIMRSKYTVDYGVVGKTIDDMMLNG